MEPWTRKRLDLLHFSINNELKLHCNLEQKVIELISIKNRIAASLAKNDADLTECRSQLCLVCRANQMYSCDVDVGWSANCAFVGYHTGQRPLA